jgi:hypothetical protein
MTSFAGQQRRMPPGGCAAGGAATLGRSPTIRPRPVVQARPAVNTPSDLDERQAVQMAWQVAHNDGSAWPLAAGRPARPAGGTAGAATVHATPAALQELAGSAGRPLDRAARKFFEPRFGYDFSQVRVHADQAAAGSVSALDALAFTYGAQIAFSPGTYRPGSADGRRLLAHELTHVVQQGFAAPLAAPAGLVENRATAGVIQRQGRGDRGAMDDREEGRETRTNRAHEDDRRRRRPEGGRDRSRGLLGDLDSDWAGRAILERYLFGEGDWDISDSPHWTEYMEHSRVLRDQLQPIVIEDARRLAALHRDETFSIARTFHADLENGEGIIGYQYLHGTNATVGDFAITGSAGVEHVYGQSIPGAEQSIQPGAAVMMHLQFKWNDMIDPNYGYQSDTIKSIFAEVITLGEAESYRLSIGWTEECQVWLPEEGVPVLIGYPGD